MALGRQTTFTWLGHATFLIGTPGGKTLILDPWLRDNPACPERFKNPGPVDAVLITHGHFDHVGDAVEVAARGDPPVIGAFELCAWLEGRGVRNTVGMNLGGATEVAGLRVHMVRADHGSGIATDSGMVYGGPAAGYVIEMENGFKVYCAGDTALFGDMTLIGELYSPDLAILPIGGLYTMDALQAARACRMLGVEHVIPAHYKTFPALTQSADQLIEAVREVKRLKVHVLAPGQTLG